MSKLDLINAQADALIERLKHEEKKKEFVQILVFDDAYMTEEVSGVLNFKPSDIVSFYTPKESRFTHLRLNDGHPFARKVLFDDLKKIIESG